MSAFLNPDGLPIQNWRALCASEKTPLAEATTNIATQLIQTPNAPLLQRLPKEVLLLIGEACEPSDLFNFSLACKYTLHTVGACLWPQLHSAPDYKSSQWSFLKTLQKDLPQFEQCYVCQKLHPRFAFEGPRHESRALTCYKGGPSTLDFGYNLRFSHVQLAMDRHFLGAPHGIELGELAVATPWRQVQYTFGKLNGAKPEDTVLDAVAVSTPYFRKLDVTPLVKDDELLLAITQRYWFHGSEAPGLRKAMGKRFRMEVCAHQTGYRSDKNILRSLLLHSLSVVCDQTDGWKGEPQLLKSSLHDCQKCPTVFRVSVHWHGSSGVEIAIESWQNLGSGRDVTDQGWKECYGSREKFKTPKGGLDLQKLALDAAGEPIKIWESFADLGGLSAKNCVSAKEVLEAWKDVDEKMQMSSTELPEKEGVDDTSDEEDSDTDED
jgi:hypothetical protein